MKVASRGSVLLMTLVFFLVFVAIMGTWLGFATRQNHAVVGQEQKEQSFHVSEAGINYVLHLLNAGICTPPELTTVIQPVADVIAGGTEIIGKFVLTVGTQGSNTSVRAVGYDKNVASKCQLIEATIQSFSGALGTKYRIQSWDHKSTITCGDTPVTDVPPSCAGVSQPTATPTATPTLPPTSTPTSSPTPTPISPPTWVASTVFVTNELHPVDPGGLARMDQRCQIWAVNLPNASSYMAIMSNSTTNARDRFNSTGPVRLVTGEQVADNSADLWDGTLDWPINISEDSTSVSGGTVWSGTEASGLRDPSATSFCNDWTSTAPTNVELGLTGSMTSSWISLSPGSGNNNTVCNASRRLYCIGPF